MGSGIFQLLAVSIFVILIWRMMLVVKLDNLRKGRQSSIFIKYILGAYALEALLPIIRRGNTKEESDLIRIANVLITVFYILAIGFFITTWLLYK
jgi:hypothetical protein